jgi:hypothetical protein
MEKCYIRACKNSVTHYCHCTSPHIPICDHHLDHHLLNTLIHHPIESIYSNPFFLQLKIKSHLEKLSSQLLKEAATIISQVKAKTKADLELLSSIQPKFENSSAFSFPDYKAFVSSKISRLQHSSRIFDNFSVFLAELEPKKTKNSNRKIESQHRNQEELPQPRQSEPANYAENTQEKWYFKSARGVQPLDDNISKQLSHGINQGAETVNIIVNGRVGFIADFRAGSKKLYSVNKDNTINSEFYSLYCMKKKGR